MMATVFMMTSHFVVTRRFVMMNRSWSVVWGRSVVNRFRNNVRRRSMRHNWLVSRKDHVTGRLVVLAAAKDGVVAHDQ